MRRCNSAMKIQQKTGNKACNMFIKLTGWLQNANTGIRGHPLVISYIEVEMDHHCFHKVVFQMAILRFDVSRHCYSGNHGLRNTMLRLHCFHVDRTVETCTYSRGWPSYNGCFFPEICSSWLYHKVSLKQHFSFEVNSNYVVLATP